MYSKSCTCARRHAGVTQRAARDVKHLLKLLHGGAHDVLLTAADPILVLAYTHTLFSVSARTTLTISHRLRSKLEPARYSVKA